MTDQQPHTPPECDHHWITYMQPSAGLSWIRQCSQCRDFDADDLQEQIADAEQRGKAAAWDEGSRAYMESIWGPGDPDPTNPYRDIQGDDD